MAFGKKTGGRQKGTPNKASLGIQERLQAMGVSCDPFYVLAIVANGTVPCGVCFGKGKTKFQPSNGQSGERVCQSCWGSKREQVSVKDRTSAAGELASYYEAKRKAIELSGSVGAPDLAAVLRERYEKRNKP